MQRHDAVIRKTNASIPGRHQGFWIIAMFGAVVVAIVCWGWIDGPTEPEAVAGSIAAVRLETGGEGPARTVVTITLIDGSSIRCSNLRGNVGDRVSVTAYKSRLLGRRVITC